MGSVGPVGGVLRGQEYCTEMRLPIRMAFHSLKAVSYVSLVVFSAVENYFNGDSVFGQKGDAKGFLQFFQRRRRVNPGFVPKYGDVQGFTVFVRFPCVSSLQRHVKFVLNL